MAHSRDGVEADRNLLGERTKGSSTSNRCLSTWWNQGYRHQEVICRIIESMLFRALVIFLVVLDTGLIISEIMLDHLKIHYRCERQIHHTDRVIRRIDLAMEIAYYASIGILVFFVVELVIKIYASGREFWNIHRKKMEYFDAFIVITSLIISLYFGHGEKKVHSEELLLIFSFRLWRFVRIVSSVAEGVRHGQVKHKHRLNRQYLLAIRRLVDLLIYKTNHIDRPDEDKDLNLISIREHFGMIDTECQSCLDELNKNHQLTSSHMVTKFIEKLQGLEQKEADNVISRLVKPPDV